MNNYLLIGTFCAANFLSINVLANDNWKPEIQKDGVQIYTKIVEDSALKAFKGIIEIDKPKQVVMDIVSNVNSWSEWVPDVVESTIVERSEKKQIYYVKSDLPWPIRDRDGAYCFDFVYDSDTSSDIYKVSAVPDAVPLKQKVIRILKAAGEWTFTEIEPARTKVSYKMHVEPGGTLPSWIINASVTKTPFDTLVNLKRYAMNNKHQK